MTDSPPPQDPGPTDPVALAALREAGRGTLIERLGIELTAAGPDGASGTMPVAGNTQPAGLLHGGATLALAETLASISAVLLAGPGRTAVGVDVSGTHHRAVREGTVTGVAVPLHQGSTVASYEVVVRDERDRRICTARVTCLLRDLPADRP